MVAFLLLLLGRPGSGQIVVAFVMIMLMLVVRGVILFAISSGRLKTGVKQVESRAVKKPAAHK